ncbi:MAG: homocysteine S-methyltransferase family protein [Bryobacterales bacterium]|nr:homocysteine S-methyltransferase family protein [Bryobacterales bacterium]
MLAEWLAGGPLVADGAWGTEFQKLGLAAGESPDSWNLDRPGLVEQVARGYVEAGSRIILTNTFRANRFCFSGRIAEINRAGVEISKRAAAGSALVFASMGPSGKLLVSGDVSGGELRDAFSEQAAALAAAGPDALLIETISDLEEARIALGAALETGLPVIVSFVFDTGKNKDRTMMGDRPEQVAEAMESEGASGVGANCGVGIEAAAPICARLRASCSLPIWIKPNAGLPEVLPGGEIRYRATPEGFASHIPALLEAGASFLGGCCGSDPGFIRAITPVVNQCA